MQPGFVMSASFLGWLDSLCADIWRSWLLLGLFLTQRSIIGIFAARITSALQSGLNKFGKFRVIPGALGDQFVQEVFFISHRLNHFPLMLLFRHAAIKATQL